MEYIVKGRNFELNDRIKNYADKKIKTRINKLLDKVVKIEVKFNFEKNPRINLNNSVEVTVFAAGSVIRTTDSGTDVFEAIDRVSGKLERQLKKFREKLIQKSRKTDQDTGSVDVPKIMIPGKARRESLEDKIRKSIVKTKTFALKPMPPEEAVIQMEMLGHDFFVFINSETERTAVVYIRKDKNYGLIEPTI